MQKDHAKKLIGLLAASGFLNITLLTLVIYGVIKEQPPALYCKQKLSCYQFPIQTASESTSCAILRLRSLPPEQLVEKLKSLDPIENGYAERDLALASLVAFYHFDISRALKIPMNSIQQRAVAYGYSAEGFSATMAIFPGMTDDHFSEVLTFAANERWPLTPSGLFKVLQGQQEKIEPSLVDAFCLTPEFLAFEALFRKSVQEFVREDLIKVLVQGSWQTLEHFFEQQQNHTDHSDACRRVVLKTYIHEGSIQAATMLLKTDGEFATKKLDDHDVLTLLSLLHEKSKKNETFALALLRSPRSTAVWKMAASRLYDYADEKIPEHFCYQEVMSRFLERPLSSSVKAVAAVHQEKKKDCLYIIQEGDNLWKISKQFQVSIDLLRAYNRLPSDLLRPGSALRVPIK